MAWAQKVFIDSTALFQLGPRLETVDFARLLEFKSHLAIQLCVSEVSWREYLRQRREEIKTCIKRIRQSEIDLAKYGQTVAEFKAISTHVTGYLESLEAHFSEKASQLGLSILPLPPIDLNTLLRMSIDCTPPFERANEKGFRDSLIMFTILSTIQGRPGDNALLITGDQLLSQGCRGLVNEYQTCLNVVESFDEAVKVFESEITELYRQRLRQEGEAAKAELLKHRQQISERVREIRELTEADLGQGFAARLAGRSPEQVHEVLSLSFTDVESALWKDKDKPASRILFKIRCDARVNVREPTDSSHFEYPKYTVGGGITLASYIGPGMVTEKTLPARFYGEAEFVSRDESWELKNLKIDRRPPEGEDLVMLSWAQPR